MPTINVTPGALVDFTATVTGSQPIMFSLSGAPNWLSIGQLSGRLTGSVPAEQAAGTLTFEIVAQNCFSDGQPGNTVRLPMTIIVGSNCQPVSIYDSQTGECIQMTMTSTTYTNTIAKGQIKTDFTIRVEGDESPGRPIVVWTNSAGATLTKLSPTSRDYKLEIDSGNLEDGTYTYNVFGMNCTGVPGLFPGTNQTYTVIVGSGVGGPPATGGGGGGACTATINAPGSHPIDQTLNYQLAISNGQACGMWQTWLLYAGESGGATGSGSVPGQIDSVSTTVGNYTKNVSNLAPGNYVIWGKCNDPAGAGSCRDTYVSKPIQLTAAGTPPGTGGGNTPCTAPKLVPVAPARWSMRPGTQMSFEIWLADDSPVEGVALTARDLIGAPSDGGYLRTSVAWTSSRRYNLTIITPPQNMPAVSTLEVLARNPCGNASLQLVVDRDDSPVTPPTNCVPTKLTAPAASRITTSGETLSTLIPYTGSLPVNFFSRTHPNVWFASWLNNTIKAEGSFGLGTHNVVLTVVGCDGVEQSVVWNITPA